jgi:hypothetical protein
MPPPTGSQPRLGAVSAVVIAKGSFQNSRLRLCPLPLKHRCQNDDDPTHVVPVHCHEHADGSHKIEEIDGIPNLGIKSGCNESACLRFYGKRGSELCPGNKPKSKAQGRYRHSHDVLNAGTMLPQRVRVESEICGNIDERQNAMHGFIMSRGNVCVARAPLASEDPLRRVRRPPDKQ